MPLKFKGKWRFTAPADGEFHNQRIPRGAVEDCIGLIIKVATQGDRQGVLEHFKGYFCEASGATHVWSSNASWAETDLWSYAEEAAKNAPLFIEAFYDACQSFGRDDADLYAPDVATINALLAKHEVGYEIRPPRLVLRDKEAPLVAVAERPSTLREKAVEMFQGKSGVKPSFLGFAFCWPEVKVSAVDAACWLKVPSLSSQGSRRQTLRNSPSISD